MRRFREWGTWAGASVLAIVLSAILWDLRPQIGCMRVWLTKAR